MDEQLRQFGDKTRQLGIREYYSVYQWDWDYPDPGKLTPRQLQQDLLSSLVILNSSFTTTPRPRVALANQLNRLFPTVCLVLVWRLAGFAGFGVPDK